MQFQLTTFTFALLAALTTAAPAPEPQSQGGYYSAVGYKYSGPGCTTQTLIFADPIFGDGNVCQALSRQPDSASIVSYSTVSVAAGCSGESRDFERHGLELTRDVVALYTTADCSGTAYLAPEGGCVTGSAPFVSTFITCKR